MPFPVVARRLARSPVLFRFAVAGIGSSLLLAAPANAKPTDTKDPPANTSTAHANQKVAPAGPITDHFSLRASFFAPSVSTDARFDSGAGLLGTPFNAESDFGLDDKIDQGRIEMVFRLRDRHRVRVDYFKLDRDGDKLLNRQIVFGNSTYRVNDRVLSSVSWRMLGLTYTWSALRTDRFELGVGIGVHLISADARGEVRARNLREKGDGVGPMPTAAIDGTWQIAKRWSVNAHAQQFSVSVSDVKGSMSDYHFDTQYRWVPNAAVGIGYSLLKTDVTLKGSGSPGQFTLDTRGPELFFRVSF